MHRPRGCPPLANRVLRATQAPARRSPGGRLRAVDRDRPGGSCHLRPRRRPPASSPLDPCRIEIEIFLQEGSARLQASTRGPTSPPRHRRVDEMAPAHGRFGPYNCSAAPVPDVRTSFSSPPTRDTPATTPWAGSPRDGAAGRARVRVRVRVHSPLGERRARREGSRLDPDRRHPESGRASGRLLPGPGEHPRRLPGRHRSRRPSRRV